jgi:hypothetical protein
MPCGFIILILWELLSQKAMIIRASFILINYLKIIRFLCKREEEDKIIQLIENIKKI